MYKVSKTTSFSYGHRLYGHKGKCKNLHGHNARVELVLAAETLDHRGMVADFTDFGAALKKWVDSNLDHKTILGARDPLRKTLKAARQDCFVTQDSPTAETLARLIFFEMRKLGLPVAEVKFRETETSMASYSSD